MPKKLRGMNSCSRKALTSTRSPMLIVPVTTPLAAKNMIAVTPRAMIAPWPKFRSDIEAWLLTAYSSHCASVPS
jgi:hypothetical protein